MRREGEAVIAARAKGAQGCLRADRLGDPEAHGARRPGDPGTRPPHRAHAARASKRPNRSSAATCWPRRLLTDILKLDWADVHDEAHRMEHAISPLIENADPGAAGQPDDLPARQPDPGHADRPVAGDQAPAHGTRRRDGGRSTTSPSTPRTTRPDALPRAQRPGPQHPLLVDEVALSNATITVSLNGSEKRVAVGIPAAQVIQVRQPS